MGQPIGKPLSGCYYYRWHLTIHSSRRRLAARLNSGVRALETLLASVKSLMNLFKKIASFFQRPVSDTRGEAQFLEATKSYAKIFAEVEPLTIRGQEATEFSSFLLDPSEFQRHQEAIAKLTSAINHLRDSFNEMDQRNSTYEQKFELYSAACEMYIHSLNSYSRIALLTSLVTIRKKFDLMLKKVAASCESLQAERAVDEEIDEINSLSRKADLAQKESEKLESQMELSLDFIRSLLEGHRKQRLS